MPEPYLVKILWNIDKMQEAQSLIDELGQQGYIPVSIAGGGGDFSRFLSILFQFVEAKKKTEGKA